MRQAKLQLCVVLTCVLLYNVPRFCEAYLETLPVNVTVGADSTAANTVQLAYRH